MMEEVEIMPLKEVEPGMRGVWRTVTDGREIREFELEVIGIAPNFAGPRRPAIIAQALDPDHIQSGPVGGMSGSPVYIDGRLAGAYAYGYTWPKEQAIIGITPIEQMLEILDEGSNLSPGNSGIGTWPDTLSDPGESPAEPAGRNLRNEMLGEAFMAPRPMVHIAGFSAATAAAYESHWRDLDVELMSGSVTMGGPVEASSFRLEPGLPVAAVLMSGDFSAAATGTITWRDGERLLGFGHQFLQWGNVAMPMAGAEILTVVRNVRRSFTLSRTGPIVGTIFQDRLTGVAGEIGPIPQMVNCHVDILPEGGSRREFSGEIVNHPRLLPILSAMAVTESLRQSALASAEETFLMRGTIVVDGFAPIEIEHAASGPDASLDLGYELLQNMTRLLGNHLEPVNLSEVSFEIDAEERWHLSGLDAVRIDTRQVEPGSLLDVSVRLDNFRSNQTHYHLEVPIPDRRRGSGRLTLFVGPGSTLDALEGRNDGTFDSVEDLVADWRERRPNSAFYVALLEETAGLRFRGEKLPSLPPSMMEQLNGAESITAREGMQERVVWESAIPVAGIYMGEYRMPLEVIRIP